MAGSRGLSKLFRALGSNIDNLLLRRTAPWGDEVAEATVSRVDDVAARSVDDVAGRSGRAWRTVAEETGEVRSFRSFSEAKRTLGSREGHELHHIVEQSQANPSRAGFDIERINTTDNLTYTPTDVHRSVSAHYSTRPPGAPTTVRNMQNNLPWDDQYEYGSTALDDAYRRIRGT